MSQPLKIFIIYARKDAEFKDELIFHLKPLQLLGLVDTWHDGDLQPGAVWDTEIKNQLRRADIIIALVSTDFINSDYIQGTEFKEARQRWERGEAEITPVVVRDCLWEELASLADLQALPSNGQKILPVTRWPDRDEAWTVIANGLKGLCVEVRARRQQAGIAQQEQEHREKEEAEARRRREMEQRLLIEQQKKEDLKREKAAVEDKRRREAEQFRLTEQEKQEALAREKAEEEERRRREEAERQATERRRKEDAERIQREAEATRQAEERRRQDDTAWQQACSENTIAAFEYYLGQHSPALRKDEALKAIKQLRRERQSFWARYRYGIFGGAGVLILLLVLLFRKFETPTTASIEPEMVHIPGGTFQMGSEEYYDEKPVHTVTVSDFWLGRTEVTVAEFKAFADAAGYHTDAEKEGWSHAWSGTSWKKKNDVTWRDDAEGNLRPESEHNHPVIHVSWNDAKAYRDWLSEKTGKKYRLPTETEWEYAAGNGAKHHKFSWGDGKPAGKKGGNVADESAKKKFSDWWKIFGGYDDGYVFTAPVASFDANDFGLYDMSGNVWEWCEDVWHENYSGAPTDGSAWTAGGEQNIRVVRGGSWGLYLRPAAASRPAPVASLTFGMAPSVSVLPSNLPFLPLLASSPITSGGAQCKTKGLNLR